MNDIFKNQYEPHCDMFSNAEDCPECGFTNDLGFICDECGCQWEIAEGQKVVIKHGRLVKG